jgi:CheY-like chemotaxis protein
MAITGERITAAGYADDAEWRPPGQRPSRNASARVAQDDLVTRNGRLSGNGKPPRVLIVDDDPAIRMLCSINLQIEGLRALEAADGERGLEQVRSERPDLVVTDVMMPGLDGFQLAEALRSDERTRQIPLIFLSSSAEMHFSRETVAELLASGGFFWLDLDQPDADDFVILREVFGFHPLAVEDSEHFDQRAKIEDYDDFVFLVVYGASPDEDRLVEVTASTPSASSSPFTETTARPSPRSAGATRSATRRSIGPRCCSTGSSMGSSTASSRSWPTSTTGSRSSRTRSSASPATSSCRRSSP